MIDQERALSKARRNLEPASSRVPPRWRRRLAYGALAVAALLLLWWMWQPAPEPVAPVRSANAVPETMPVSPLLQMTATVERISPAGEISYERAQDGVSLERDDGLAIRFDCRAGRQLTLIEARGTAYRFLYTRDDVSPDGRSVPVTLVDQDGTPLRYVPERGAGDYLLVAMLTAEPLDRTQLMAMAATVARSMKTPGDGPTRPWNEAAAWLAVQTLKLHYEDRTRPVSRTPAAEATP